MSTLYPRTTVQICNRAARIMGISKSGSALSGNELSDFMEALNMVIKELPTKQILLYGQKEGVLFFASGESSYLLGPSGDRACAESDFVETTLSATASAGAFTISVESTTGVANSDKVGVVYSPTNIQWAQVSSFTSSSITLNAALTDDADSGAKVFIYTTLIDRPIQILSARLDQGDSELPMQQIDRAEYFGYTMKDGTGTPTQFFYTPELTNGRVYVWPACGDVGQFMRFTYLRALDNYDSTTDTGDFPDEALNYLVYALAWHMLPEYPDIITSSEVAIEKRLALSETALRNFHSQGSVYFTPG